MLSIVASGIMGTSYRKDVVVDGGMDTGGDLAALSDVRHKLSFDFGGDAPQSGWLMQLAPTGMWLSRLELALDEKNSPAYIMVSFLIPRGCQLQGVTPLGLVVKTLMMNRRCYIDSGNIIRSNPDWGFLNALGLELEACLTPCSVVACRTPIAGEYAYYSNPPAMMLNEMWSDKFSIVGTIFCGKGLLSLNTECPNIEEMDVAELFSKQEEVVKHRIETEEERKRQEDEFQRRKKAEEARMWLEEETRRRKEAEETKVKLEEEARRHKEAEDERIKQEEARRIKEANEAKKRQEEEERLRKEKEDRKRQQEEEKRRREAEEEKKKMEEIRNNGFRLIDGFDYNKSNVGLAVAAVITTLLGGWLGIVFSIILLGNIKVRGVKYHKYRKGERIVAIVCLVLAPIIMLFWFFVILGIIASVDEEYTVESSSYKVNGVVFNMNGVEGGTFMMGADGMDTQAKDWEKPAHWVTLSDYCIGETEVTQELWEAVMGSDNNMSEFKGAKLPVERVSWEDCQVFLAKLNNMTGEEFRLPTEAEWEFAARGGNHSKQYMYSGSNNINEVAWYFRNSGDQYIDWDSSKDTTNYLIEVNHCRPHAVKQKKPNELGLYDMTGNVLEWYSDWYDRYSSISVTNPQGPESANPNKYGRVRRGGYYLQSENYSRITYRIKTRPEERHEWLGLRLALSV